jgi:hypothetical protein
MAQPAPTARQCAAVLTGVMIRHGVPLTESLTADLTVVVSREAALLEYLTGRARARVEQELVHSVRSGGFRGRVEQRRRLVGPRRHCRGAPRRGRDRAAAGGAAPALIRAGGHGRQRRHHATRPRGAAESA